MGAKSIEGYNWLRDTGIIKKLWYRLRGTESSNLPKGFRWNLPLPLRGLRVSLQGLPAKLEGLFCISMYIAYILKSEKDGSFYYGSCQDIDRRLREHNAGKGRYTKSRMPWVLHYFEQFKTRSEVVKRERFFKSIEGYNWLRDTGIIKKSWCRLKGAESSNLPKGFRWNLPLPLRGLRVSLEGLPAKLEGLFVSTNPFCPTIAI